MNDGRIEPKSECLLPAHVVYGDLSGPVDQHHWSTALAEPVEGLRIARTLVKGPTVNETAVRVCNTTDRPI